MLIRRLNYLNSFAGNRSEMERTMRIVAKIWDDARHEEEPEDPDFYPAPYELQQEKWVEKVGLKVGDKVRIVKKWEKGEGGCDCAMGFLQEVNLVGYVDSIEKDSIYVALHSGPYHTPYFALEKVEDEYRPFANAEEFKPYREGWWQFRTSGVVFKVDTYQEDGVYVPGEEKRVPFDVFLDKYTNADTGEPAGVKL